MKHQKFYRKYKPTNPPIVNPIFYRKNWWYLVLIAVVVVLIEPLIMYRWQRSIPFSLHYYLGQMEYLSFMVVPFIALLFWINRRELIKRSRGYGWEGKFEVIGKRSSFIRWYLLLEPGDNHKLKVDRSLFEITQIGDSILIRRDALGNIEEVNKIKNLARRLTKARS